MTEISRVNDYLLGQKKIEFLMPLILTSSVISKRRVRPTMLLAKVGTDLP